MKPKEIEKARLETMAYCYLIAKEKGVEGLEEEIRFRRATRLPIAWDREYCDEIISDISKKNVDAIMSLVVATLHDEFGFGEKRSSQFAKRLMLKAECLTEGYLTWDELIESVSEDVGFLKVVANEEK